MWAGHLGYGEGLANSEQRLDLSQIILGLPRNRASTKRIDTDSNNQTWNVAYFTTRKSVDGAL